MARKKSAAPRARKSSAARSGRRSPAREEPGVAALPASYVALLNDLKNRIRTAQVKATLAVNREMIGLYWDIGRSIVERQKAEGWGKSVVDRLGADLQKEFPGESGYSKQNLWYMRRFYLAWTEESRDVVSHASQGDWGKLQQAVGELPRPVLAQLARELDGSNPPQAVAAIPWGHNIALIEKLKDPIERLWYARQTTEYGWSRAVLGHQIETDLYRRQGRALTNFDRTLLAPDSDLAQQAFKDPYCVGFLPMMAAAREREFEHGLVARIRDFLLELGVGFAFVGQQVHMEVGGQDFYIDLLFYHFRLRCFVVVELKNRAFEPEFAGKMNFYLAVVDDQMRHPDDGPSIGLILCKEHNRVIVEYALKDATRPMGVARWELSKALPEDLRGNLPSPAQIEAKLIDQEPADDR
jgi:predicted nuclease of restriction endonuclease-like (RecB) superfamily